jgi:hypothetical protein
VPTKIQRPEQALQLAQAYNIKGKLPLVLDEVVVPVHIVGQLDPSQPQFPSVPATASRYGLYFTGAATAGAGSSKVLAVQYGEPNDANPPKRVLIESVMFDNPANALVSMGVGFSTGVAIASDGPFRFSQLDRSAGGGGFFGQDNIRAWEANTPVGPLLGARLFLLLTPNDRWREVPLNIILGTQRSAPYWLNGAVPLVPGNAEFWIQSSQNNGNLGVTIRASVLND